MRWLILTCLATATMVSLAMATMVSLAMAMAMATAITADRVSELARSASGGKPTDILQRFNFGPAGLKTGGFVTSGWLQIFFAFRQCLLWHKADMGPFLVFSPQGSSCKIT